MQQNTDKRCIIDRFEKGWAVIEYGRITFNFPRELVPKNAKEGDVLSFAICINQAETDRRRKYIENLTKDFFKEE